MVAVDTLQSRSKRTSSCVVKVVGIIPNVTPVLGDAVAKEVLQWIGAFRLLNRATIISYGMQDYEFWGNGFLSDLLIKQLANGAQITVMTTPPPGTSGNNQAFKDKLMLLEELDKRGANIFVHPHLHAKAYLFKDSKDAEMVIVGSPNLTRRGFGTKGLNEANLLELALLTEDSHVYASTTALIVSDLIGDAGTMDFATWVTSNLTAISNAKGAP